MDDLDAAEEFYGGILHLARVLRAGDRHVFYRCGTGMLLIFNPFQSLVPPGSGPPVPVHGPTPGQGHACFAATGPEIDRWCETFKAADVPVEAEFSWPNGARSLYVRDPAGNSIEFAEPWLWDLPA